ncbi:phosphoenolpyruvate synthase [Roseomonas frigidaquae]|uniref:Phosphoenolpyruvate synthase n=1 Tax=Falsiroseomonas frigidaquae TaxID=487318 RepID=A0ABX1F1R6_9PROT|nr:phosphoenolpyruvate synthase [Falsiroseomonas frigidaquae]NKE46286.1 phosphoenolpyruvate synthase [Falsiroseomonas frigidaquae]
MSQDLVIWFEELGVADVPRVGGKNASLGEMTRALGAAGVQVPAGFATTATAYHAYLDANGIAGPLRDRLADFRAGTATLQEAGEAIRQLFLDGQMPARIAEAVRDAYRQLGQRQKEDAPSVAVRSSATAEDLPTASFAGQQETFLNVRGETALLDACRRCYASLFTDRAIAYREAQGFDHLAVALSIGVQVMVRSDLAGSGVIFTLDTETGFPDVVVLSAAWGLGETVVQGTVEPDKLTVFKPLLDDERMIPIIERTRGAKAQKLVYATGGSARTMLVETTRRERESFVLRTAEVLQLARWAVAVERHYGRPMDLEWAKDGRTGELFIVQARPETVQARRAGPLRSWHIRAHRAQPILTGSAVGEAVAAAEACVIRSAEDIAGFRDGAILVTEATDPDWVPIMRRAAGIVTDHGGTTSHAAIVSRELGVPAVVGTGHATTTLKEGQIITLSCAEGDEGRVYEGRLEFSETELDIAALPPTRTALMLNLANPAAALRWWRLPAAGVGLARMEFIINDHIRIHPMALVRFDTLRDEKAKRQIQEISRGWPSRTEYFVDRLAQGIARLAAPFHPHPVILRLSDFKTNEYAHLLGGAEFEPAEENPMLGLRGASRYYSDRYRDGFALECRAIRRVREEIGLRNLIVMVPFCRSPAEADRVLAEMARNGLRRGEDGLQVYVMCEIPSNVILAEEFAARFDGFSIGSNDLTQLVLGVDRDSAELAPLFDERDEAVKRMIADVIRRAHACGAKVGICGEAPSNHPDFAAFLVEQGIDSISLNPDSFAGTLRRVAEMEAQLATGKEVAP